MQLGEEDDIVALWEAGMNLPVLADTYAASDWDCIVDALLDDKLLGECSDLWFSPECRAAAIKDAAVNRSINSHLPHCSVPLIRAAFTPRMW